MENEASTAVFVSDRLPVIAVLHLVKLDDAGRMRSSVSVRSSAPLPVQTMLQVQVTWHEWIRSCSGGSIPALPDGWRFLDGGPEALTSVPPDHHH